MNKIIKTIFGAIGTTIAISLSSLTAFAADEAQNASTPDQATPTGGLLYYGVMIVLFLVVGYFFLIRPEKKRKKEAQDLRDTLKPGNRITTIGGIVGTVEKITDEKIYLTNGLVLKRWALRSIDQTAPDEGTSAVTYYEDEENEEDK